MNGNTVHKGFTLAELLIALAILGVIATFTIPKILSAQQNQSSNAKAKEAISMISAAFTDYKLNNAITSGFRADTLTPYMNYVSLQTTSINYEQTNGGSNSCTGTNFCLRLHSGGTIRATNVSLAGTANTNAIYYYFDPDGQYDAVGGSRSVVIFLYANGRITSWDNIAPSTVNSLNTYNPPSSTPYNDPPWFSW